MKTNKFLTFLSVFTLALIITSCVEDDDYTTPNVTSEEPDLSGLAITTFSAVVEKHSAAADTDGNGSLSDDEKDDADNFVGVFS